eukprot:scaffold878_cov271-Pinguiococcus_pyrenoidosus.AAC.10
MSQKWDAYACSIQEVRKFTDIFVKVRVIRILHAHGPSPGEKPQRKPSLTGSHVEGANEASCDAHARLIALQQGVLHPYLHIVRRKGFFAQELCHTGIHDARSPRIDAAAVGLDVLSARM